MTDRPSFSSNRAEHSQLANALRVLAIDAIETAKSGHPGMPMGMADVATVLWGDILKHDPAHPEWPDRDRFVLSAGHGSMLLYALLHLTGYPDISIDEIRNFRQVGSRTAGHPEYGHAAGIETTTGPLGQGFANAVGMALGERLMAERFGPQLVDHYTYALVGDGCLMEGISHEAASMAGHLKLAKLIVLFDDNGISIDGPTSLTVSDDQCKRFTACGWDAQAINGHDPIAIMEAIYRARASEKPSFIACRTTIGYGAPSKAGSAAMHGSPLGVEETAGWRSGQNWPHAPFEIPGALLAEWRELGERCASDYQNWLKRFEAADEATQREFARLHDRELPEGFSAALDRLKQQWCENPKPEASRVSSKNVLDILAEHIPELLGGSADLSPSNGTMAKGMEPVGAHKNGRYIHYGVREHAMAAAMNGLALHGGFIPYGGTFLVFSDYSRPAIRLSALMKLKVIHVMTHDSIGVGEDGPTHQPVEHLASLRAIPNLHVFRPGDPLETLECWALAIARRDGPSLLALSRQNLTPARLTYTAENRSAKGGYILREPKTTPQVVLLATGSEVSLALKAADLLAERGVATRIVSLPCFELFDDQPTSYRREVLGDPAWVRIGIEAAIRQGWEPYLGEQGEFVGMSGFGASGPGTEVYAHFGITAEAVLQRALKALASDR